jgi:hypothetical protein
MGLCPPRASLRDTGSRTVVERALKGERTPGEHRRAASAWPGGEVVAERTPGGSKASKRACRPFTGEPSVGGEGTVRAARPVRVEATGLATARNRRPGSCVPRLPSGGRERQRAGAIRFPVKRGGADEPRNPVGARGSGARRRSGGALWATRVAAVSDRRV